MGFQSKFNRVLLPFLVMSHCINTVHADPQYIAPEEKQEKTAYSIQVGDRVGILVLGRQDISGTYQVDMAGEINLPTLGEIGSEGLTTEHLGKRISDAIAKTAGEPAGVSATIVEYRPIYVLGDVKISGMYAFTPGMTTLQAVAMAGGFFDSTQAFTASNSSHGVESNPDWKAQYQVLSLRRLRLLAEKENRKDLKLTPELEVQVATEPLLFAVYEAEKQRLTTQRDEYELKLDGYLRSSELFDSEAHALEEQIKVQKRLQELEAKQADAMKSLRDKGMASQTNYLTVEHQVTETQNDRRAAEAALARARQNGSLARQSARELEVGRQQELEQSISDNARELLGLKKRMELAGMPDPDSTIMANCTPGTGNPSAAIAGIRIIRADRKGDETIIQADRSDPLLPGDVVKVSIRCNGSIED